MQQSIHQALALAQPLSGLGAVGADVPTGEEGQHWLVKAMGSIDVGRANGGGRRVEPQTP